MNNEEKKELVRLACEGYIYESEDENFIRFAEDTFAEQCNHDDDIKEELNKMASKYFEKKAMKYMNKVDILEMDKAELNK